MKDQKKIITSFSIILYLLLFVFIFPLETFAAGNFSVGIYPAITYISASPPTDISTSIVVENKTSAPEVLQISLRPFVPSIQNDGTITQLLTPPDSWENKYFLDYVHIMSEGKEIKKLELSPLQKQNISLEISLPKKEISGDYYFSVLFLQDVSQNNSSSQKSSTTIIQGGVSTNVLVSINKEKPIGSIEAYNTIPFWDKGPILFTLKVKNAGSSLFIPEGRILIKNMFGQIIGKLDVLPTYVLADSDRYLLNKVSEANLADGSLPLLDKSPHIVWNEGLILGLYTATLELKLSEQGPTLSKTIHFGAFPFDILLGILIAIFIIMFIKSRLKKQI